MKFLFLDIDGVLNSTGSVLARTSTKWETFTPLNRRIAWDALQNKIGDLEYGVTQSLMTADPTAIELVNRLQDRVPNLGVVLSSTHRVYFTSNQIPHPLQYNSEEHLNALQLYLEMLGLRVQLIGITPRLHRKRGEEVQAYLDSLKQEPETYVILDDGADFGTDQSLVQTNAALGFTSNEYFEAAKILGAEESIILL